MKVVHFKLDLESLPENPKIVSIHRPPSTRVWLLAGCVFLSLMTAGLIGFIILMSNGHSLWPCDVHALQAESAVPATFLTSTFLEVDFRTLNHGDAISLSSSRDDEDDDDYDAEEDEYAEGGEVDEGIFDSSEGDLAISDVLDEEHDEQSLPGEEKAWDWLLRGECHRARRLRESVRHARQYQPWLLLLHVLSLIGVYCFFGSKCHF
ncbi:uncharacterized protein VTP21DRAFT_8311 [Calcarisporiella thermophila]|uniref:uncharacterized protein n=1 Tax=Calcarisporiella thermophila TaxID=911321 RepID=UPI0037428A34